MSFSEWEEVKLGQIVDIQIDNRGRNPDKYLDYSNYPVIDNYLIKNQKYPDMTNVNRYIDKDNFESFLRGYLEKDDVLITLVGNGIGNVTMSPSSNSVIIQNTIGLRTNNTASNLFLYYLLLYNQDEIKNFDRGTSQPSIRKTDLFNLELKIPPLQEQKAIAHILSTLDEKIEANNKINKTLEEMAQAIFKHWFVDFEFPNEDGEPYKSSGGEMVPSELGPIPKGWKTSKIENLTEVVSKGTTPRKKDMVNSMDSKIIKFLKVKDIQDNGKIDISNVEHIPRSIHENQLKRSMLKEKDILLSIAGTIGRVSYVNNGLSDTNINQAIAFIRLKDKEKYFPLTFYHIKSRRFQESIQSKIVQGVQANVSLSVIKNETVIVPEMEVLVNFNSIMDNIIKQIDLKYIENNMLVSIRDTLLPKLMSGEIRVPLEEDE